MTCTLPVPKIPVSGFVALAVIVVLLLLPAPPLMTCPIVYPLKPMRPNRYARSVCTDPYFFAA